MAGLLSLFRQNLRSLWRSPGFTFSAILTLMLGLGGTLALVAVVHGVLLRPLPYPEPHRLAAVTVRLKGEQLAVLSPMDVSDLQSDSLVCQELMLFDAGRFDLELEAGERLDHASSMRVEWNLLGNLGARPILGRSFQPEDGLDSVLLSFEGWRRIFGGDPDLPGRTLMLDGKPHLVVGVLGKGLRVPDNQPTPDVFQLLDRRIGNRGGFMVKGIARLKPGATLTQLNADFTARSEAMAKAHPDTNQEVLYGAEDLQHFLLGDRSQSLLLALCMACLLLLIACINVAHLFLSRRLEQRQELALRCALGASTTGLLRQHLLEGMAVGLPAAVLGLGSAWLCLKLLPSLFPDFPDLVGLRPDAWEVLVALLLVLASSLVFALLPLWQLSAPHLEGALRSQTPASMGSGRRTRAILVVAESALAVLMLAMGGVFLSSFLKALHRDPGYRLRVGLTFGLVLPERRYPTSETTAAFQSALRERLGTLPEVRAVVLGSGLPNGRGNRLLTRAIALPLLAPREDWPALSMAGITPGYFAQMGIPLLSGRDIQASDRSGGPLVAVLSATASRQLFPGRSALGQRIQTRMGTATAPNGMAFEIVGVCGDVVQGDLRENPVAQCYFALGQLPRRRCEVALATGQNLGTLRPLIEAQVKAMDPRLSLLELSSLEALELKRLSDLHQATWLLGLFAGLGIALGLFGVGSVVSYQVAKRTREIGLRMALGASVSNVLKGFMGEALLQVWVGSLVGAALAAAVGRVVASRLFQTQPTDPLVLAGSILTFCTAAAIASLLPALRAARLQPADALRTE